MKVSKKIFVIFIILTLMFSSSAQSTTSIKITGSGVVSHFIDDIAQRYETLNTNITIDQDDYPSYGSFVGLDRLVNGLTDIATMSIAPNTTQISDATAAGVSLVSTNVAQDALVIIVNKNNPINNLTTQQIKDIYSGVTYNWSDLGWVGGERIVPVQRDINSGLNAYFSEEFMGGVQPDTTNYYEYLITAESSAIFNYVRSDERAIAYGNLAQMLSLGDILDPNVQYKALVIDGNEPTKANALSGAYPYILSLYMVVDQNTVSAAAQNFIDYILTPEGQFILDDEGYLPIGTIATGLSNIGGLTVPFSVTSFLTGIMIIGIIYRKRNF